MRIVKRKVVYELVDVKAKDVLTLAQAARRLELTVNGVKNRMKDGSLTWLEDQEAKFHGRLLVLRSEVEAAAAAAKERE